LKKKDNILSILKNAAVQSGVKVIYEGREPVEGYCRVNGLFYLVFNKNSSFERQLEIYRTVFKKIDIEDVYLLPIIRKIIEGEK